MHRLQFKLLSLEETEPCCALREPARFLHLLWSREDPKVPPRHLSTYACSEAGHKLTSRWKCAWCQFLKNWCLRKRSTNTWAQMIGQGCTSTLDVKCSLGHQHWTHFTLLSAFRDYFENLLLSQNPNTFKNPHCRLICSYSDWKPKQKPSSDFFFSWNRQLGRTLRALAQAIWSSPHEKSVLLFQFALCSNYL